MTVLLSNEPWVSVVDLLGDAYTADDARINMMIGGRAAKITRLWGLTPGRTQIPTGYSWPLIVNTYPREAVRQATLDWLRENGYLSW